MSTLANPLTCVNVLSFVYHIENLDIHVYFIIYLLSIITFTHRLTT